MPDKIMAENVAALALDLTERARASGTQLLYVDETADRLTDLARAAAAFDPALAIISFPPWDTLPYDRADPQPGIIGRRVAALASLAHRAPGPALVLTSARAVLGRLPPPEIWETATVCLQPGDAVDLAELAARLHAFGYADDDHVDEPGHMAIRPHVVDIFPGDADTAFRLPIVDGRCAEISRVDPVTQRSSANTLEHLVIRPVREASLDADASASLVSLLDYVPKAAVLLHRGVPARWTDLREQLEDAYQATSRFRRAGAGGTFVPPPSQIYAAEVAVDAELLRRTAPDGAELGHAAGLPVIGRVSALFRAVQDALAADRRVVIAAGAKPDGVARALAKRGLEAPVVADWPSAAAATSKVVLLPHLLPVGFHRERLTVLATPSAAAHARHRDPLTLEEPPRCGDRVVHRSYGVCRLRGLARVGEEERVALEFAGETELLVPADDLAELWRYGSEAGAIALDRVDGEAWRKREAEIAEEIAASARALAAAAQARSARKAPIIEPPAAAFARFNGRFPFALSVDQAAAIEATLTDLRSGKPMDRLVCGDVGFGKTEVALRAAAACALSGFQVAVVAPTTVLARQHWETFTRRFARMGIPVVSLIRGAGTPEEKATIAAIADGSAAIVVGTQALAGERVRFSKLALVIVDEEQRFGEAQKKRLAAQRGAAGAVHSLVMTATPIPRTLEAAMVGLREVSVIATAPVRRQPVRTYVLPWDGVVVREALLREHARGGQSFAVCARIEDLGPMAKRLAELTPELRIVQAHGRMKPEALEAAVTGFAHGEGDVLLATNIIEAGLDIPRANTILISRPDRFGLAQLHQMRGRVGRGPRRAYAYLLTESGKAMAPATERRLRTLEAHEQLGAGFTISLADLDARGAGDLFGDKQAGHIHAVGTELYQHLLAAELAAQTGKPRPPEPAVLHTELSARIPEDYVPEPNLRLELYRRFARLPSPDAADDLAEELHDRFGDLPEPVKLLLDLARLRAWCSVHGVSKLDAGPQAVALSSADPDAVARMLGGSAKEGRVILPIAERKPPVRLERLLALLAAASASRA